jgi:hypothetical protein
MQFHAVMVDETGCEFGVTFDAKSYDDAYDYLHDCYPESRVDQVLDASDHAERERARYLRLMEELEYDY